jgi:hypothetical protein
MMVTIPAELAEQARHQAELARQRRERYDARHNRVRHDLNENREGGHKRSFHYRDYPFIGWDGEAPKDTGYSLFGSSEGHEICSPNLTTEMCFDLLLEARKENPYSIFIWYGGRYDWDEITRMSIPLVKLARLKEYGTLWWHGYRLTECEGKVYTVAKHGVQAKIYEISGWFHKPYVDALRDYGIGGTDLDAIASEKNRRADFVWSEIEEIRSYMRLELKYMGPLMEAIRRICLDAGFDPRGWYGPSALARQSLTINKVFRCMATCPQAVNEAAMFAFAGGRFELFRGGILGYNCTADKNSAYMHAALNLPNLAKGQWRRGRHYETNKFAVYKIRYRDSSRPVDISKPQPLFRRLRNGSVIWPRAVEGWYWAPEAELVKDNGDATFLDAWIFDEETSERPFNFVRDLFCRRLVLQSLPETNPSRHAEKALKWALAAIYGQLARTVGWDKKKKLPPRTHQLEWAGYILSHCRAEMYRVALRCGDNLVSIDTDSVTSLAPISVKEGRQLGEWKVEHHDNAIYFQNGVYFTQQDDEWNKGKTRGMERRRGTAPVTPELLTTAIATNQSVKMLPKRRYITTRMALAGQFENHGKWVESKANTLHFGGGGKRYHNRKFCAQRCSGNIHVMFPKVPLDGNPFDIESKPHHLPWIHGEKKIDPRLFTDFLWVDTERIDSDDYWEAELVRQAVA